MIVPMKKATILVQRKNSAAVVDVLKKAGLLHPVLEPVSTPGLELERAVLQDMERAISLLPEVDGNEPLVPRSREEIESLTRRINQHGDQISALTEESERLRKEIARIEPWGNFEPADFSFLAAKGIELRLVSFSKEQAKKISKDWKLVGLSKSKNSLRAVHIGSLPEDFSGEVLDLPDKSLESLRTDLETAKMQREEIEQYLATLQQERTALVHARGLQSEKVDFLEVEANIEAAQEIGVITGYFPASQAEEFKALAAKNAWGLVVRDPGEDDQVPTLIKNPMPVRMVKPIFDFLGTVPGYFEKDISTWFFGFFTIFFAMIIGDAGYGALSLVTAIVLILRTKLKRKRVHDGLLLFAFFSTFTLLWGAVTGNWFGLESIADFPFFSQFVIPAIDGFEPLSSYLIQYICFVIGTVHLVLARTLNFLAAVRRKPHIHAVGQLGWLAAVVGLYHLVLSVVLSATDFPVPTYAVPLIAAGLGLVFLFEYQGTDGFLNGIKRSLVNLIPLALGGVSTFSDIISYIRLYAVGLASLEIARSFNTMGQNMFEAGVGGIVGGVLVILLGHSLNLAMAALSLIVHGVRLNLLEFSSHIGNEWKGFAYRPFGQKNGTK